MTAEELQALMQQVAAGSVRPESAAESLAGRLTADLGYAQLDLERRIRCGFPEVIYCEGKAPEWVAGVVRRLAVAGQDCLGTRVGEAQAELLQREFPTAEQDRIGRTFWLPAPGQRPEPIGNVLVVTAGTTDLPVARECVNTVTAMGVRAESVVDAGVAGLHRILRIRDRIAAADAIVVVAGMDGALPSVVGGLADCPVIACPTSVGYGASFGGLAALLTMLNACSAGVVTVNIDAGFKAGYTAALIARKAARRT